MFGKNEYQIREEVRQELSKDIYAKAQELFNKWKENATKGREYTKMRYELIEYKAKCSAYEKCLEKEKG